MWKREARGSLKRLVRQFPCVCILGARQVGKTTLAKSVFPRAKYFDLESPTIRERVRLAPEAFLADAEGMLILDEIQFFPELWEYLKVEIDSKRKKRGRFVILGSANPALLIKASETLAGRIGFLELDPLISREIQSGLRALTLENIWLRGGYPEPLKQRNTDRWGLWMDAYIRTFVERDLPAEGVEAKPSLMWKLLHMIAHVHGGIWNASQLAASTGVSYHTVDRYLEILERSFLIRRLPPYFVNIGKRLVKAPKIYLRDSGLCHFLLGIRNKEDLLNSPRCGSSWEGFILEEIIRSSRIRNPQTRYFFYRTHRGVEADLVIQSGKTLTVVEVKFGSRLDKSWIQGLRETMADIGASRGALIYSGGESFAVDSTIQVHAAKKLDFLDAF